MLGERSITSSKTILTYVSFHTIAGVYVSLPFIFSPMVQYKINESTHTEKKSNPTNKKANNQIQQNQKQIPKLKLSHVLFVNIFRLFQGVSSQQDNFETSVLPSVQKRIEYNFPCSHCTCASHVLLDGCTFLTSWPTGRSVTPKRGSDLPVNVIPIRWGFTVTPKLAD